jgi:ABC-type sugar transport system ATPase subunit
MREIFRVADRVTVLRDGELVSTKAAAQTSIEETISLMVGRALPPGARLQTRPLTVTPPALEIRNLQTRRVRGVNLRAARGEVIGIAGLVGSGRSALGEALFGLSPWLAGEVTLAGRAFRPGSPRAAIASGFAYLPEDRRGQGLFLNTSIRHNAAAAILDRLRRGPFIQRQRERQVTADELARTRTKAADHTLPVSTLSGGNQQKVLLAKWLLTNPEVLFLDDPTRGVDIGAKADVYQIIESLSAAGKTVLLVSSELSELLRCSHRIMVLHEGRMAGLLDTGGATREAIMTLATGMASKLEKLS